MSFNLIRNSRVFFTTNVGTETGLVAATGFDALDTFEIQVLDGMSFTQNTSADTVTINESGATPVRGQRSFNTALAPVDFSFSTYMRPADTGANISCEESVLWNSLMGTKPIGETGAAWTTSATKGTLVATNSNSHQLQKFGLIILLDSVAYVIDNCALDTATVDFGLDAIAMVAWVGKAAAIRQVALTASSTAFLTGDLTGAFAPKNTAAPFIANKLSTMTLSKGISGTVNDYNVALTGGSLTISNNLTYLTPAILGVVNKPVTYFTGTRAISGSINAYLKTGAAQTGGLLADMLAGSSTTVDPKFNVEVSVGGAANATKVVFKMPAVVLTIPTVATQQVVSTTINFTAQGYTGAAYDIGAANEITVEYFTTNVV